jgi:DNA recombination protein RmuC
VPILALLIGLAVGAAGVYVVALRRSLADRDAAVVEAREAQRRLAECEGMLAASREAFDERLQNAIKSLTTDALQANANAFTDQALGRLGVVVEPLQKSLEKVETNVQLLEQQRQRAYGEIHKELEIVRLNNEGLSRQTGNLVSALRGNSQVRGQWGEIQLRRVIEMAGMLSYCDFDEQQSLAGDDGRLLRPDVIVKLPGGKSIVIDSKVSLAGYLTAHAEDADDEARRAGFADHARQVRTHIQTLGQKAYWRQLPATPEFVVMFLHDESSWLAALDVDPSLHELALANNVIPATPTNLIGLLRAVHYGWQQETIAEGARQISDLGRELYKRLSTMGAHMSKLGRSLDGAVKSYNETVGSLERQGGCCPPPAASSSTGSRASSRRSSPRSSGKRVVSARRSSSPMPPRRKARSRSRSAPPPEGPGCEVVDEAPPHPTSSPRARQEQPGRPTRCLP